MTFPALTQEPLTRVSFGVDNGRARLVENDGIAQVQWLPGSYIEAVHDSRYRGWVIGQWEDNPHVCRVAFEEPVVAIVIGGYDEIRPAERTKHTKPPTSDET